MSPLASGLKPRLLIDAIESQIKSKPDSPYLLYANSSSWEQEGGYRNITWKQFGEAIDKVAFWLDQHLPWTGQGPQTIAYIGPNDPRYFVIIAAAVKSKRRVSNRDSHGWDSAQSVFSAHRYSSLMGD